MKTILSCTNDIVIFKNQKLKSPQQSDSRVDSESCPEDERCEGEPAIYLFLFKNFGQLIYKMLFSYRRGDNPTAPY